MKETITLNFTDFARYRKSVFSTNIYKHGSEDDVVTIKLLMVKTKVATFKSTGSIPEYNY